MTDHIEPQDVSDVDGKNTIHTIVAVGASAGGLEALRELLASLSGDIGKTSVIIAQHLSPTHKSMMVQLLQKNTRLNVVEAENGQSLEAGTVYITPPDKQIIFDRSRIMLRKPDLGVGPKPNVDTLFFSLCEQKQYYVIGVILSGTGSDGSTGTRALKESGGYVIIQDPKTAKYDGMPQSALLTGMYDAVLPPSDMGSHIRKHLLGEEASEIKQTPVEAAYNQDLEAIFELLSEYTGTDFSYYKRATIERRLKKRMMSLKLDDIPSYLNYLQVNPEELDVMFHTILIGVTQFFRDKDAFDALEKHLKKLLTEKSPEEAVRVWIPGCSTGEEAYSIAILIHQFYGELINTRQIQIFATDIHDEALSKARLGIYSKEALLNMPDNYISAYFSKRSDGRFELVKSIRTMVLFTKHDVTRNPPFLKLDLISCRNMLIYFGDVLQGRVLPVFHYGLKSAGILFLGKSESVGHFSDLFGVLDNKNKLFSRKIGQKHSPLRFSRFPGMEISKIATKQSSEKRVKDMSIGDMVKETLFTSYEHPYVVIDNDYNVVEINGDVRLFLTLPKGSMQSNVLRMMNPELQIEGRSVINRAIKTTEAVRSSIRKFELFEKIYYVRITCKPLLLTLHSESLFIVVFEQFDIHDYIAKDTSIESGELVHDRIQELEMELAITKEHLQTYIEEIETTNEELQSLNEELQSSNEELQSTNEELETTNEELQSTNEEVQIAYAELDLSKKDLEAQEVNLRRVEKNQRALLNNTQQAFILVDNNFRIVEFNQTAEQLYVTLTGQEMESGGNMAAFGSNEMTGFWLKLQKRAFKGELGAGEVMETRVNGEVIWLSYNITPIINDNGNVDVISVGLIDISDKKTFAQRLSHMEQLLHSIFDTTSSGICITDETGLYIDVNAKYCQIYGYSREELIGKHFTIVVPEEYEKILHNMHDDFIKGEKELDAEWVVQRKDGKRIDIFATARLLEYEDGSRFKVTSIHDITESKKYEQLASVTQEKGRIGGWELDSISRELSYTVETSGILNVDPDGQHSLNSMYSSFVDEGALALEKAVNEALKNGTPFDLEIQLGMDCERWIRITCKPIAVYDVTVKLFGTVQDVSKRREYEATLLKKNLELSNVGAELRASLKEKETLLAEIHHRVKNNLAVVSSMMQMQLMEETDQTVNKKLYDSITRISTIAAIHEDLYSTTSFSDVNFTKVTGKLVHSVGDLLSGNRNIEIMTNMEDFILDMSQAIPSALIMNEVITNVYKHAFIGDGGRILVTTSLRDNLARIEIEDNGVGLPVDFSLDSTETLGMQIIRTLTEQLNGSSGFDRKNPGTCFWLEYPVEDRE